MDRYIVIVAGGHGTRMGSAIPKQFLEIAHRPILMRTIETFCNFDKHIKIIVVLPAEYMDFWRDLCAKFNFGIEHKVVSGGKERFFSVKNALEYVPNDVVVGIHDAVRPFVSNETLKNVFHTAEKFGTAVPVMPATESVRRVCGENSEPLNRKEIFMVQTPQCFNSKLLKTAYNTEYNPLFTDDASVVELTLHEKINLTEGNVENIKITTPYDINFAEWLLTQK